MPRFFFLFFIFFFQNAWSGFSYSNAQAAVHPTSPFTIQEPQYPWIEEFYVVQKRRATDLKAPKLWKGSLGSFSLFFQI